MPYMPFAYSRRPGVREPLSGLSGGGGSLGDARRLQKRTLVPDARERRERSGRTNELYDAALADPGAVADQYGDYFRQAAEGYAAPQQREFQNTVGRTAANVAGRFGGNASSIELSAVNRAGDDFSRNLTEGLARLAPEQVAAGQRYTDQLGGAASEASSQYDRALMMLMEALRFRREGEKKKGGLLGAVGGVLGGAAGSFLGPAGTAFGAEAGRRI